MSLAQIAQVTGGRVVNADPTIEVTAPAVIDSREVQPGGLFVAFVGERADGHDFAAAAMANGAAAVMGSRETTAPTVVVDDVQIALGAVARDVLERRRAGGSALRVLAVTGSQGKTSTKDLLAHVLAGKAPTVATAGSFNNEIGLPLTVLRTGPDTEFLLLEMGARGRGHIRDLCAIATPDVSVVLNVGRAHLGEFGSQEAIAAAKGELVEALGVDGVAVLNADDAMVHAMAQRTQGRVVTFGQGGTADLRYTDVHLDDLGRPSLTLSTGEQSVRVAMGLVGAHHAVNAAAAAAAALAVGLDLASIGDALAQVRGLSKWRMELTEPRPGLRLINDSYNANPDSMAAALQTLAEMGRRTGARTIAVLGEMRELGEASWTEHQAVGELTRTLGIDTVVVVGEAAEGIASMCDSPRRAPDVDAAVAVVREDVGSAAAIVLVKASRGAALDRVAAALTEGFASGANRPADGTERREGQA